MENQDIYNIYKLYKEEYYKDELGDFKDPERELEYYGYRNSSPDSRPARSEEPYEEREYSVEEHREDEGKRVYYLYKGEKFIDDYYARSSEDKVAAIEVLARRNGISPREIEGYYGEENAENVGGESRGFSIGNELFDLYSNLDRDARTRSGASVSEELKMIIDELKEIVSRAEQFGSKFDLIKQLRLD